MCTLEFFATQESVYCYAAIAPYHFSLSLRGWIITKNQVFDSVYSPWIEGTFSNSSPFSADNLMRLKKKIAHQQNRSLLSDVHINVAL